MLPFMLALAHAAPPPTTRPSGIEGSQVIGECVQEKDEYTAGARGCQFVFGEPGKTDYVIDVDLRLIAGSGDEIFLFPAQTPAISTTPAAARIAIGKDKEGAALSVYWNTLDPETKKWTIDRQHRGRLEFWPTQPKTIERLAKDGFTEPKTWVDRWMHFQLVVTETRVEIWLENSLLISRAMTAPARGQVVLNMSKGDRLRIRPVRPFVKNLKYLPLNISALANGKFTTPIGKAKMSVGEVPFELVDQGAGQMDLRAARWPQAKNDPSSYIEEYDGGAIFLGDPRMPIISVPPDDYAAVNLLAVADNGADTVPSLTIRAGKYGGNDQVVQHDFVAAVPTAEGTPPKGVTKIETPAGALYHVRVPFNQAFAQDIRGPMDLEFTKEVRLARRRPDPSRFRLRPLGLPSGVRIAAVTLERSPLSMRMTSKESGHAFVAPKTAQFDVTLQNITSAAQNFALRWTATALDGTRIEGEQRGSVPASQTHVAKLDLKTTRLGYHDLVVTLNDGEGKLIFSRTTSFATLPPDTRKFRESSPMGTWDFSGGHFTSNDPDVVGSLYQKAGLRYGMFNFKADDRAKYGVIQGSEPKGTGSKNPDYTATYATALEKHPDQPPAALLLHENSVSGANVMRVPDAFTDRPPYQFSPLEKERFDHLWKECIESAKAFREKYPKVQLKLGNGPLPTKEELLRAKFPSELFDSIGNESGTFGRPPESQPPDYVAFNASLWMDHKLLEFYGYKDKPVTQCYEICYPCTNPGNLDFQTQADYFVRHTMHALAWRVPVIRIGCISDTGNSYRYSNWGGSGLTNKMPELNVKPSYVAIATMTRVLDGAKFERELPLGSESLYCVEFALPDSKRAYVLWTLRGERAVKFSVDQGEGWSVTDGQGNTAPRKASEGAIDMTLTPSPVYLVGPGKILKGEAGPPKYDVKLDGRISTLAALDSLDGWSVETGRDTILEYHNFMSPRRKGDFAFEAGELDGEKACIKVTPRAISGGKDTMPMYGAIVSAKGIPMPGQPTAIGLKVRGNSGWGRVIFEFKDASGQTWTSIGAPTTGELSPWMLDWMPKEMVKGDEKKQLSMADWNTDDVFGDTRFNFDGWRKITFPMPGHYPGEGYPWAGSSQWRYDKDGVVHYPLTFTRLVIELPEKVLHLTEFSPPRNKTVAFKELFVVEDKPEPHGR